MGLVSHMGGTDVLSGANRGLRAFSWSTSSAVIAQVYFSDLITRLVNGQPQNRPSAYDYDGSCAHYHGRPSEASGPGLQVWQPQPLSPASEGQPP